MNHLFVIVREQFDVGERRAPENLRIRVVATGRIRPLGYIGNMAPQNRLDGVPGGRSSQPTL